MFIISNDGLKAVNAETIQNFQIVTDRQKYGAAFALVGCTPFSVNRQNSFCLHVSDDMEEITSTMNNLVTRINLQQIHNCNCNKST